jgi:ABC-type transport system substrate-binding protein
VLRTILVASCLVSSWLVGPDAFAFSPFGKQAGGAYRSLPAAPKVGTLYLRRASNPKVLNPFVTGDVDSSNVIDFLFAHLLRKDYETGEYYPEMAEKFEVSKDRKVLTFTLRKDAVWEDGSPVTTEDAEFSFQTLMNPKTDAAPLRTYFEGYKFEKVDSKTSRFLVDKPNVNTVDETLDDRGARGRGSKAAFGHRLAQLVVVDQLARAFHGG